MNTRIKNLILMPFNLLYRLNPKLELSILYRIKCGVRLNLENPRTYLEKLNWLKLYYRSELMPICADKFLARKYMEDKGFGHYLPRLLWEGIAPEKIPFDALPQSFVIKSTVGSGNNIICTDKTSLNRKKTIKQVRKWLTQKYLPCYGEWHYQQMKPRILIEEYLCDAHHFVPLDYKLFCFNGLDGGVGCVAVDIERYIEHKRNIYDSSFAFLEDVSFGFPSDSTKEIRCPSMFEEMKTIAATLAQPFPHIRVDFFVVNEKLYIGELTFFNGAGFDKITPQEYNLQMGNWIKLPSKGEG